LTDVSDTTQGVTTCDLDGDGVDEVLVAGNATGAEPTLSGSGADGVHCIYDSSDIHAARGQGQVLAGRIPEFLDVRPAAADHQRRTMRAAAGAAVVLEPDELVGAVVDSAARHRGPRADDFLLEHVEAEVGDGVALAARASATARVRR
jgi:hypothetical protein